MHVTDPIAFGGRSRATVELAVRSCRSGVARTVQCRAEDSDDGVCWTMVPDLAMDAAAGTAERRTFRVRGSLLRFVVQDGIAGYVGLGAAGVSLHVRLDRE